MHPLVQKITAGVLTAGIMMPSLAFAQSTSTASLIQQLQQQIQALTAQILALKNAENSVKDAKKDIKVTLKELRGQISCGATGDDVALLQTILSSDPSIFPEGIINGVYGPKTREAVKRFQRLTGLTPTGCVGPQTLNALNRFLKQHPIIVQSDGSVCALVVDGKKPKGWERELKRDREDDDRDDRKKSKSFGVGQIPACSGGIPQSILDLFGIGSTTPFVPGNNDVTQDELTPGSNKVTMCHKPGKGKTTIYVSASAIFAHIGHGDKFGACSGDNNGSDTTAPSITNVTATNITQTSATVTWTTNEGSTSQVEYGTTAAYGATTTLDTAKVTSHSVNLSGLTNGTVYHFRVISKDTVGNQSISGDMTFTTGAADTTGPSISAISVTGIGQTGATVIWTTNEGATTQVEYGTTAAYGSTTTLNSSLVTSHSQVLAGLTAGTVYHYRVLSKDGAGNLSVSGDLTFTTSAVVDATAPTISGISLSGIGSTSATVFWNTNEAATSKVYFSTSNPFDLSSAANQSNSSLSTSHSIGLSGLSASTTYYYVIQSADAANNTATTSIANFTTLN